MLRNIFYVFEGLLGLCIVCLAVPFMAIYIVADMLLAKWNEEIGDMQSDEKRYRKIRTILTPEEYAKNISKKVE